MVIPGIQTYISMQCPAANLLHSYTDPKNNLKRNEWIMIPNRNIKHMTKVLLVLSARKEPITWEFAVVSSLWFRNLFFPYNSVSGAQNSKTVPVQETDYRMTLLAVQTMIPAYWPEQKINRRLILVMYEFNWYHCIVFVIIGVIKKWSRKDWKVKLDDRIIH